MISVSKNLTLAFNKNKKAVLEIGEFWALTIHVSGTPSGTISILGTNDGGDVTGTSTTSPATATNFTPVQAINLATGTAVTSITAAGLYQINPISFQYLQIGDGSTAATTGSLVVFLTKIR